LAPNRCAKFHQNRIKIAAVRVFTDKLTERQTDVFASDFIITKQKSKRHCRRIRLSYKLQTTDLALRHNVMLVSIGLTAAIHGARLQKNVSVKRSGPRPKTKPTEPRPRRIAS